MEFGHEIHELKGRALEDENILTAKTAELEKINKNLNQAKDDAMQSWLDSRPLIDELEKTQAELATAKARFIKSNTSISDVQSHIETTDVRIKSTKDEELKLRSIISDKNQDLHTTQEEMEQIKLKIDQKRRMRSRLKQELRIKKHTLRTLQLTYEAIRLESEAFGASEVQAAHHITNSEEVNAVVKLTREEYDMLKREAREQNSLAEWRISVSLEEKLAAENRRDLAFRRLEKVYQKLVKEKTEENENNKDGRAKLPAGVCERKPEREFNKKEKYNSDLDKKKKSSCCAGIKSFLCGS